MFVDVLNIIIIFVGGAMFGSMILQILIDRETEKRIERIRGK